MLPLLRNASLPQEVQDVLVTDLMNREDTVKLPALLDVAKIPNHPYHEEALTDLQIFLDQDNAGNWSQWDTAVKAYLKKQQQELAAPPTPGRARRNEAGHRRHRRERRDLPPASPGAARSRRARDAPVLSTHARQVIAEELGRFDVPEGVHEHSDRTMNVPFVSGSARFDAMVILPCSMGTLGRIAAGTSESTILRAADVFLKERRKLILVPREMPWSLIHARNAVTVIEAGAILMPASPSFYAVPETLEDAVDTVVDRVLDQLGLPADRGLSVERARGDSLVDGESRRRLSTDYRGGRRLGGRACGYRVLGWPPAFLRICSETRLLAKGRRCVRVSKTRRFPPWLLRAAWVILRA